MKGDFSRARLDLDQNHSRALLQQGRPLIDSDWNEQIQILWENQRTIFGPKEHGYLPPVAIAESTSFKIEVVDGAAPPHGLKVHPGTYVFDGRVIRTTKELFAAAFTEITGGSYRVELSSQVPQNGQRPTPPEGKFVVALVAQERELFYEESKERDPRLAPLRASVSTKMDWGVFLVHVEGDDFAAKRAELNAKTDCAFSEPPALRVNVPQVTFDTKLNRLYRVEVHDVKKLDGSYRITLKLTVDNAAYSLPISKFDGLQISLNTQGVDPGQLPTAGEWVEIESLEQLPWVNDRPAQLLEVDKREDDRLVVKTAPPDLPHSQLTRWQLVAKDVNVASPVEAFAKLLEVQFHTDDVQKLKPGDWWEILIRTAKPDEEFLVRGFRQSPYYAPLADITVVDGGSITIVERRKALETFGTGRSVAACPETPDLTPVPTPAPIPPVGTVTPIIDRTLLDELACRKIFTSMKTAAANRWLASAKFGEIAALSRDDLRTRIKRDCPPDQYDDETLERDVTNIVDARQEFLAGRLMII